MKTTAQTLIHVQFLVWEPLPLVEGAQGTAWIKTLARDDKTGARTALVRYDAGYRQRERVSKVYADVFVIKGEMSYGGRVYRAGTYFYRPPGTKYGPIETPVGVTTLVMNGGREALKCSQDEIFVGDLEELPWEIHSQKTNRKVKILRSDEQAQVHIHLSWAFEEGGGGDDITRVHDHYEEAYCLAEGEYLGGEGEMTLYEGDLDGHYVWGPGTYLCRYPFSGRHGNPCVTKAGRVSINRREGWTTTDVSEYPTKDIRVLRELPRIDFLE